MSGLGPDWPWSTKFQDQDHAWIVICMGNPWVLLGSSLSISICIHTHNPWVWVFTGLHLGMDMGMDISMNKDTALATTKQLQLSHHLTMSHSL